MIVTAGVGVATMRRQDWQAKRYGREEPRKRSAGKGKCEVCIFEVVHLQLKQSTVLSGPGGVSQVQNERDVACSDDIIVHQEVVSLHVDGGTKIYERCQ